MPIKIINADVFDGLAQLPDESVHCCVTSPPYWGLRSYLPNNHPDKHKEIGQEKTFADHLNVMLRLFDEVRRVLRKDGTLWLNYGDAYATHAAGKVANPMAKSTLAGVKTQEIANEASRSSGRYLKCPELPEKNLLMMPARLAIALQEDGWWLRSEIVWAKKNCMPESVTDRPSCSHEKVFLLTKSARYFYDAEAVREPGSMESLARYERGRSDNHKYADGGPGKQTLARSLEHMRGKQAQMEKRQHKGFNERWDAAEAAGEVPSGRNMRNVWHLATEPFSEAHFATMPTAIAERAILAGTSETGCCSKCGAPWIRETKAEFVPQQDVSREKGIKGAGSQKPMDASSGWDGFPRGTTIRKTLGWKSVCNCDATIDPCIVLDPFGESGTTGLVADRLRRSAILIDLHPDYPEMMERRIRNDAPLFAEVMR